MSKTLPPLPALPPAEVQEWSESWITLRGEGWTRETVEKYASDYALAAIEKGRDRQSVPAFDSVRLTRFLTDVVTAAGLLSHGKQSKAVAERVAKEACAIRSMLAAAPQPQPLSDQEIADAAPVNETLAHGFKLGVRWADAAHGIKE